MVHQPLPDPRQIGAHLDAEIHQRPGRPDAGAQQVRRRMDRAGADDDFAPGLIDAEFGLRPFDERLDADAAGALEEQLGNLRLGRDRQVRTAPRAVVEIADRGRDAAIVKIGDRDREIAVSVLAVLVVDVVVAGRLE